MWRLEILPAAKNDIVEIVAFIRDTGGSRDVADRFAAKLLAHFEKLASFSVQMGRPRGELLPDLRSVPFGNCIFFIRYAAEALEIVHIIEAHRDVGAVFGADNETG